VSNFLAIATVTASLKRVLQAAATEAVPGAVVRPGRPEAAPGNGGQAPGIDLYLYQVTPAPNLRNEDLPTRRADGALAQRPRVALDLHYLLTFRGDEATLEPQRLLGNAARALHAAPVITADLIALAQTDFAFLAASDLADAVDLVKLAPVALSTEELSKLWSVFFQIPYNLSMAYLGTVVVIEGAETPRRALPVRERLVYVQPFQNAFIAEVASDLGPDQPILAGGTLVLRGRRLAHVPTRVSVRGVVVEPSVVTDTEVRVPLTVPPFPAGSLRAGVQGGSVVHPLMLGAPPVEHAGFESNVAAFVLRPRVMAVAAPDSTHVNVTVNPELKTGQRAVLLLNRVLPGPPGAHVFTNRSAPADTATPGFVIAGVSPGTYFVRVQIDGAESPVDLDAGSPTFGPTVTIP
jgi:hypothetical protein